MVVGHLLGSVGVAPVGGQTEDGQLFGGVVVPEGPEHVGEAGWLVGPEQLEPGSEDGEGGVLGQAAGAAFAGAVVDGLLESLGDAGVQEDFHSCV